MGILEVVLLIAGIVIFIGSFLLPSGKESGINKTILMIAGILLALMVIAGVISGILMTAKKRKKEETENERAAKRQKGKKLW